MPTVAPLAPLAPLAPDADPELERIAAEVIHGYSAAPAAVVAAAVLRGGVWARGLGVAGSPRPGGAPAGPGLVGDLASVTKPFTALAAARLARRGLIRLDAVLGELLIEARGTPSERAPLELLLAHRAGLAAHLLLYAPLLEGKAVDREGALRQAALARRPECEGAPPAEGFAPVYSDLGYLLVGEALARISGEPLEAVIDREVSAFTGGRACSAATLAGRSPPPEVAPTELVAFRGGLVKGEVHDENAWALGGRGVSGHAGLFGDAGDVLALGCALVEALSGERPGWLLPGELRPLVRPRPGGTLRAGFDGKSEAGSSAGSRFGPASLGHLGFTGTSLWVDPEAGLVGVLLTNRVHPSRASDGIRRARPAAYDAIAAWALGRPPTR